ncbi:MAG: CPBP family intramembrane glutamic endopeptidase [Thiohalospira sp.]
MTGAGCGRNLWMAGLLWLALPGLAVASAGGLATASFFVPGLGQFINGEPGKGATHLSTYLVSSRLGRHLAEDDDYIALDDRYDDDNQVITTNRVSEWADLSSTIAQGTMFYSSYDAYRSRRLMNNNAGYTTSIPADEGFRELAAAPFQARYLLRPTTFIPMAIAASTLTAPVEEVWVTRTEDDFSRGEAALMTFPRHGAVALGEEAFFRGVLNNSFSHYWGPRWGLAASSVTFGLAHSGAGTSANAAVATAYGAYLGWLHQRNNYRLGENVAVHFWWNVFVSLSALRHDPDERTAMVRWEIPF